MNESTKPLRITALAVADLAKILASASGRTITIEQVRRIAEQGQLLRVDDTVNLLEYTAYLVGELSRGTAID